MGRPRCWSAPWIRRRAALGRRRGRLAAALRAVRPGLARARARCPGPAAAPAATPVHDGAVRPQGPSLGGRPRAARCAGSGRGRSSPALRRTRSSPLEDAGTAAVRAAAVRVGPRGRLADRARRIAAPGRCAGVVLPLARRGDRRPPRRSSTSTSCRRARVVLLDVAPRQVARARRRRGCRRATAACSSATATARRAFKLDWALDGPIPWTAPECARAATVHLGGTLEEIAASEAAHGEGQRSPSGRSCSSRSRRLFDPVARAGGQAHGVGLLPRTQRLDRRHDRSASSGRSSGSRPGSASGSSRGSVITPADLERRNAEPVGGDINGGVMDLRQVFARPVAAADAYRDADAGRVSLLGLDAAGRRGARDVRLSRGSGGGLGSWALAGFVAYLGAVMDSPRRHEGDEGLRSHPNRRLISLREDPRCFLLGVYEISAMEDHQKK